MTPQVGEVWTYGETEKHFLFVEEGYNTYGSYFSYGTILLNNGNRVIITLDHQEMDEGWRKVA